MIILKVFSFICIAVLVAIVFVFLESHRECHKYKITSYEIKCNKNKKNDISKKILMFSDLHNINHFGEENSDLVKFVKEYKPDMIILAGDMIVSHSNEAKANIKTAGFINKLSEIADVYYGIGNHEKYFIEKKEQYKTIWDDYYGSLSKKVHIIQNGCISINDINNNKLNLYGLDLPLDYYRKLNSKKLTIDSMEEMLGKARKNEFNILIAHNPEYFETYAKWGADLVLSGHNHGGLVRLPYMGGVLSPRLRLFPKYDYGLFILDESQMILSNGMGAHSIKIRINNIPEIVCIQIN